MIYRSTAGLVSAGVLWAATLAACAGPMLATSAEAARREYGQVTGCSRFGRGCVTAPVRPAKFGQEVRLPGGTWYPCAGDCRDVLRSETVDFWDEHQRREGGGSRRR